ncbi:L-lysine 6-transaminase [Bdellovibrionota bacterium FG-1]
METKYTASNTMDILKKHILVDGFPIVVDFEKSEGSYLHDAAHDRKFFDFFSFFASNPIGFNHPRMKDPDFTRTLDRIAKVKPVLADVYTPEYAEFVDRFARLSNRGHFTHYFFVEGGALAVENAMKTAFDWKVRKNLAAGKGEKGYQILHFEQAFHGRSGYTLSVTNTHDPKKTMYFPKFTWPRITNPMLHFPVDAAALKDVEAREKKALAQIHQAFDRNPDDIAAILIEPIQSEGGDNHFRGEFLAELRKIADEREALLIFDEVQTGVGLTGKFWCWEHFGVKPDIVCFGKKVQVGGIAASARIDDVDSVFKVSSRINSTFGGNLTDMVRSNQFLKIIEEEKLLENAQIQGDYILESLKKLALKFPRMTNIRGRGLLIAFDLPTEKERNDYRRMAWDLGLLVLVCGERSVRLRPVLNISRKEVDHALSLFEATFKKLEAAV